MRPIDGFIKNLPNRINKEIFPETYLSSIELKLEIFVSLVIE